MEHCAAQPESPGKRFFRRAYPNIKKKDLSYMSSNMFTHISRYISLGTKSGGLATLLAAAALNGTSVLAQQQSDVVQTSGQMAPLPAVQPSQLAGAVQPVGYVSTDSDSRLQELEQQVAQ